MGDLITNKSFLNFLRSKKNDGVNFIEQLDNFYRTLELLDQKKQKRIKKKYSEYNILYGYIEFGLLRYINSNYYKLSELGHTLIPLINNKSYSSALIILRSIIEHIAMYQHVFYMIDKSLKNENFDKVLQIINSIGLPPTEKIKNYKRIHINDAIETFIKYLDDEKNKTKNSIETIYRVLSEFVHPAAYSFIVYESAENNLKQEYPYLERELVASFSNESEKAKIIMDALPIGFLLINDMPEIIKISEETVLSKVVKKSEERELIKSDMQAKTDREIFSNMVGE